MFDLISIGDTAIDTIVPLEEAEVEESHRGNIRKLTLPWGAKLPVGESISMVAGNAANNAVGAARLGLKTAIYTNVGNKDDDEADDRIIARFKKEKVDTRYVVPHQKLRSNHSIILSFKGERTILVYHESWPFQLPDLDRAKWVYLTSMAASYVDSNVMEQLVNYLDRSNAKLAFQPGTFQIKQGLKKNAKLLARCSLLVVNVEEAKHLLEIDPKREVKPKELLKGLADHGVVQVVITDGSEGSYGFDGEKYYKLGVIPAKLVEMTGAGDAYATGLVAGLFHGEALDKAMRWGAVNSASVVEQVGAQTGLLTINQLKERLKDHPKVLAKLI